MGHSPLCLRRGQPGAICRTHSRPPRFLPEWARRSPGTLPRCPGPVTDSHSGMLAPGPGLGPPRRAWPRGQIL
eukprot:9086063-Pyramimonas_sp.AAC.1